MVAYSKGGRKGSSIYLKTAFDIIKPTDPEVSQMTSKISLKSIFKITPLLEL